MRKFVILILVTCFLCSPLETIANSTEPVDKGQIQAAEANTPSEDKPLSEEEETGWKNENEKWLYYINGEKVTGWSKIEDVWYFLNPETGEREHGLVNEGDNTYFLNLETGARQIGWISYENNRYYFNEQGEMMRGWIQDQGNRYFLNAEGVMQIGWLENEGVRYYLDQNGVMQTSWLLENGDWYFLYSDGSMSRGWIQYKYQWYYLNTDGKMQTGWLYDEGNWYYLNKSGSMQTGWLYDEGNWYYLNNNGSMQTGWLYEKGKWYYLNDNGTMQTGWVKDKNKWYYLSVSGAMQVGWLYEKGSWYYLNNDGSMKTGWLWLGNKWYYLTANGSMATGWYLVQTKWYYSYASGALAQNKSIDGYYVGYSGVWLPDVVNPRQTYTYEQMLSDISRIKQLYPEFVHTEVIGKSVDGRDIVAVKIGKGTREIFINGSHHAREHMTTNLLMEMIDQYTQSYADDSYFSGYNTRSILNQTSVWFVPMVNPDGVTLVQKGHMSAKNPEYVLSLNNYKTDFSSWKANIRGVDLNRQYPAGWETIAANSGKPSSQNFKGYSPLSEPEAIALYNFTRNHQFLTSVAYHSSGEILYWYFKQNGLNYQRDYSLALQYKNITGYPLVSPTANPSGGGFTDWFIQEMKLPGFTPEIAPYTNGKPVPLRNWDRVWNSNKVAGIMLAQEAANR